MEEGKIRKIIDRLYVSLEERFEIKNKFERFGTEGLFLESGIEGKIGLRKTKKKLREVGGFLSQVKRFGMFSDPYSYVDLCSGKGILGIMVAYLLRTNVYLVDRDKENLSVLENAVERLGLRGFVNYINADIEDMEYISDTGPLASLALHCCGNAADSIIRWNINEQRSDGIFIVPCCYGSIEPEPFANYGFLTENKISDGEFRQMCKMAEYFGKNINQLAYARKAMYVIDALRARVLYENGYSGRIVEFIPRNISPKNQMIVASKLECISKNV